MKAGLSRRAFIKMLAAAGGSALAGIGHHSAVSASVAPYPGNGDPSCGHGKACASLNLPPWKYGKDSAAYDTVLMFRGNPAHTFYGTGPIPDRPTVKWRIETERYESALRGEPVVWSGTGWTGQPVRLGDWVFFGSVDCHLYAVNAVTGEIGWKLRAGRMFKGSACMYRNRIYIGNVDNFLRCVDAATGKVLWKLETWCDLDSSACVFDNRLFVAGESGFVRCIDPDRGTEIWKCWVGGKGHDAPPGSDGSETSPAVADGLLYTATYDGFLHCIRISDGRPLWKSATLDDTDSSPVISGDFVYVASENASSHVFCFDRMTGRQVWRFDGNPSGYWSTAAVAGGRVFIGGNDSTMHCLDMASGRQIWASRVGAPIWSSPCVVDDRVVFGSYDCHLHVLDAADGRSVWKQHLGGRCISTPCIVGGEIFVGTATGSVFCIGA